MENKLDSIDVIEQFSINIENFEKSMTKKLTKKGKVNLMIYSMISLSLIIDNDYYNEHSYTIDFLFDEIRSYTSKESRIRDCNIDEYVFKKMKTYKSIIDVNLTNNSSLDELISEFYNNIDDKSIIERFDRSLRYLMNSTVIIRNNLDF